MTAHFYNDEKHHHRHNKRRRRTSSSKISASCASALTQYFLCGGGDTSSNDQKSTKTGQEDEKRSVMQQQHETDASSTATTESEHGSSSLAGGGGCAVSKNVAARAAARPLRPPIGRNLRKLIDKFLHSTKYHVIVVCLVVFNWFIVIVELLINLRIFELGEKTNNNNNNKQQQTSLNISKILHLINVAVLGLFFMEMTSKAALIFGWRRFFKHPMEILDFVVVLSAFSLILAFGGRETSSDSAALLIVLRLWRVSKIISSMIAVVKHEAERKMAKERRNLRALEREVSKLRDYCVQQECELQTCRLILRQNRIPLPTTAAVKRLACATTTTAQPQPQTLNVVAEVNEMASAAAAAKKTAKRNQNALRTIKEENCAQQAKILQYENENFSSAKNDKELDDRDQNRHDESTTFLTINDGDNVQNSDT